MTPGIHKIEGGHQIATVSTAGTVVTLDVLGIGGRYNHGSAVWTPDEAKEIAESLYAAALEAKDNADAQTASYVAGCFCPACRRNRSEEQRSAA